MAARAKLVYLRIVPTMIKASAGGFDFYWDVQSSGFTGAPTFKIQSAHTEAGPWTDLLVAPTTLYAAAGLGPKRLSFQEEPFFRLVVMNGLSTVLQTEPVTPAFARNRHDFLLYREMIRRENLGLAKYHGEPGILLRRIIYGTKCTACLDETLNDVATNECFPCHGTGFTGGYYPPISIFTDLTDDTSQPNNSVLEATGPTENRIVQALFPAYPSVKFKDIYINPASGQRHEIQASSDDEFRGYSIRQIVTMSRLPITDPAYQIPVS